MDNIHDWLIPILTFLGTVFAGAGLKWIEGKLKAAKDKDDTATNLRNELRNDLNSLRTENQQHEREADEWREKYYKQLEEFLDIKAQLEELKRKTGSD